MYVCICNQVTETQLRNEIEDGATTIHQLRTNLGVTSQCGKCGNCVKTCIKEYKQFNQSAKTLITSACSA